MNKAINLSMLDLYDRQYEINNFITSFPSYPNAYLGLNEIELVNYDIFLKISKRKIMTMDIVKYIRERIFF